LDAVVEAAEPPKAAVVGAPKMLGAFPVALGFCLVPEVPKRFEVCVVVERLPNGLAAAGVGLPNRLVVAAGGLPNALVVAVVGLPKELAAVVGLPKALVVVVFGLPKALVVAVVGLPKALVVVAVGLPDWPNRPPDV
jgi:hypothetical protein